MNVRLLCATIISALLLLPAALAAQAPVAAGVAGAPAEGDWRAEFEAVCSRTDAAMDLGDEELAALIARCDRIAERLAAEPEVVQRVFLRRLKRCRELFAYVLASRTPPLPPGDGAATPGTGPPAGGATQP